MTCECNNTVRGSAGEDWRLNWGALPSPTTERAQYLVALAREADRVASLDWGAPGPHYESGAVDLYQACRFFAEQSVAMIQTAGADVGLAREIVNEALPRMERAARVARALENGMLDYGQARIAEARRRLEPDNAWHKLILGLRGMAEGAAQYAQERILPALVDGAAVGMGVALVVGALALALAFNRK